MKRKRQHDQSSSSSKVDTSKPTAVFRPSKGRDSTLSVALPGSIITNAQSHETKTALAGQIARALAVFCVDEVIVFDDGTANAHDEKARYRSGNSNAANGKPSLQSDRAGAYTGYSDPANFLIHLLSYLETPPHLRKQLFPIHPNLRTAGTLPSLDMPHHLRAEEWCQYREGVTTDRSAKSGNSLVDAGIGQDIEIDVSLPAKTRVTLKLSEHDSEHVPTKASAVSPDAPREEAGYYWGFNTRRADCISDVFTECPFEGGYDLSFGTSERGEPLEEIRKSLEESRRESSTLGKHKVVVFGGPSGLEVAVASDKELAVRELESPRSLFDHYVNFFPGQGSRTIRTEEAVWIGLTGLKLFSALNG